MANNNVASFPYAAPSDAVLSVASDNAATTLSGGIGANDQSIAVLDNSTFAVPCLLVIDGEIILATATSGSTAFTGCARGFAGTTNTTHSDGADVFGYIVAYQHNQMAAEVKSISSFVFSSDMSGFKTNENLLRYSEAFSNAYWSKSAGVTVSSSVEVLPNLSPATTFLEGDSLGYNMLSAVPDNLQVGSIYTFSIYAKYNSTAQWIVLGQGLDGAANTWAWFDIRNGVLGTIANAAKAAIVSIGNTGWYRCMVILTSTANISYKSFGVAIASDDEILQYLGTGSNDIFICGAQVQIGDLSGPMSYVKTNGTAFSVTGGSDMVIDEGDLS